MKRATRFKIEIYPLDSPTDAAWEVLAHDNPPAAVGYALGQAGFGWRRASTPSDGPVGPIFSDLDPDTSIAAAIEFADRRDTARGRVLRLLIANLGVWIPRHKIRTVGGDSGDRRVRELRQLNWPIEIAQLDDDDAWSVRLVIPDRPLPPPPPDGDPWEQLSLTDAPMTTPGNVECPTCGGDGIDGSVDAARFYAYSGEITSCGDCNGTGTAPENVECPCDPNRCCRTCGRHVTPHKGCILR